MRNFSIFFLRLLYPKSPGQVCQIPHSSIRGGWLLSSNSVICSVIIWQCTDYGLVHTASILNCQSSAVWMILCIPPCQSSVSTTGPCSLVLVFFFVMELVLRWDLFSLLSIILAAQWGICTHFQTNKLQSGKKGTRSSSHSRFLDFANWSFRSHVQ